MSYVKIKLKSKKILINFLNKTVVNYTRVIYLYGKNIR